MSVTPPPAWRILLVEDDEGLATGLAGLLTGDGHEVRWAKSAEQARLDVSAAAPDLVLLDLGLPDADGLDLCAELRALLPAVIIVVVTARTDESDAVLALDGGADDFVLKPLRTVEFLARLRAHLRRREVSGPSEVRVGHVKVEQLSRRAWVGETPLDLRPKELELLTTLMARPGEAIRREELIDEVWDVNWVGSTKTLDVHVANVRRKLSDAGDRWDRITTLRGFGYRFESE